MEDNPSNTQIKYDCITSFVSLGNDALQEETYFEANYFTYLMLKPGASFTSLQSKVNEFMKKELTDKQYGNTYIGFTLEPFYKVHLHSPHDGFEANSTIKYIYIIGAMALLILLIACFTYINLSVARSVERAREVGIRKSVGALKTQVFWQFIGESLMITLFSFLSSIVITYLVLKPFNALTGKQILMTQMLNPFFIGSCACMILIISYIAGSYPALVLSKFQPVKVLKGLQAGTKGNFLRHTLIVFQFFISVVLIASTIIIGSQLKYIQSTNLGYNRDHVIVMRVDGKMRDNWDAIKNELKSNSNILTVSKGNFTPVNIPGGYAMYRGDQSAENAINTRGNNIEEDYVMTNGLQIIAGNDLSHQDVLDASKEDYTKNYFHFIINETASKALGWTSAQEAIGKKMFLGDGRPGEVKAVIKDFNFSSLHNKIEPLVLFPSTFGTVMMLKVNNQNLKSTIGFIETKMKILAPHRPFEYYFMDEDFNRLYESEMRTGKVFNIFSLIAIVLACLGLFGLTSYTVKQKMKEVSIRKVLGASVPGLLVLLTRKFIFLVVLSFLFAIPVVWITINKWLQTFAYRVHIEWWMLAGACGSTLLIAILTISIQTLKAAMVQPVKNLRIE